MHTGVIWPRGVNIGNRLLIEANMKGCQVRDWTVGERDIIFTHFIHDMGRWRLFNVSIPWINNPSGKPKKRYTATYGK